MKETMEQQLTASFGGVWVSIVEYLPRLLAGLGVLVLGGVIAWIGAKLLVRLLVFSRVDRIIVRLGWSRPLEKGDVRHSIFTFSGVVFGTLLFLMFLENAIVIWRLTVISRLLDGFVEWIPRLVVAGITLLVGWAVAVGASRAVHRALDQEEFGRARLVGRVVFAFMFVFVSAIVLVQLQVAPTIVIGAFFIAAGALAMTFVIAVGLGSRRAVEHMWEKWTGSPPCDRAERKS